jgi:hypothetical protein
MTYPNHRLNRLARVSLLPSALLALAAVPPLTAQTAATAAPSPSTLARYDTNHNGVLDPDEAAAMQADEARAASAPQPSPMDTTTTAAGDVVKLSPFEVTGDTKGYFAPTAMSGTRLNSKLEDLGSSVTVVTKQQMEDFALLDINDVFLYEASTEGTGNFTSFEVDRNGTVIDNVAGDPNNANRIRGITSANISIGGYPSDRRVPVDAWETESLEIDRGPNSGIFGLGNASGTVNIIPAKAGVTRDLTRFQGRIDSFGSIRGALDINRPIVKNVLALRVMAIWQENEYQRKPSVSRNKRYSGMLTYKPFRETTIRGSFRYYEAFDRTPNAILPRDGISYWEQSGKPTWNAFTSTVTRNGVNTVVPYNNNQTTETNLLGPGLESGGSGLYARPSIFINPDGTVGLWMVGRQSSTDPIAGPTFGQPTPDRQAGNARLVESQPPPRLGPLYATAPSITDKSIYDWESVNLAAPNWKRTRDRNFTVELEQFFLRTPTQLLGLQLGWHREEGTIYNRSFIGTGGSAPMIVYMDVNQVLPDGNPNPYFLRPYLTALEPTASRSPISQDTFRAQMAYQLTLSRKQNFWKWFGDHTLAPYWEYKNNFASNYGYRDAIIDQHAWIPAGNARANGVTAARGYYRYYVGDTNGLNIDTNPPDWRGLNGTFPFRWYNAVTGQWINENATIGEAYQGNTLVARNLVKTVGTLLQSHFLNDRIVTTAGIRKDENYTRNSTRASVAPDGIGIDLTNRTWAENWTKRVGRTKTYGVVVKPLRDWKWIDAAVDRGGFSGFLAEAMRSIDLHYNKSDSFLPSTAAHNLIGAVLPDPGGSGKDYGFGMSFWNNKLYIRFNKYETVQENSRAGDSGTIASRASRLDFSNTTGGSDRFNLYRNELAWVAAAHPTFTTAEVATEVAKQMELPEDFLAKQNELPIADTSDVTSRGTEIEVNFNPTTYFRSKLNVTQSQTVDNHLSPAILQYINMRMPVWQKIIDPNSNTPWWTTKYGGTSPEDFYTVSVIAPYKLAVANEGKLKSQIREWRVNALGSLQLGAFTSNRYLKQVTVMGAVRWEDKASIGYLTLPDDPNTYDPNGAVYDKPHTYFDAGLSYRQRIYHDRIGMTVQLNGRNITENGRLQPVAVLPNGQPHSYRIIDPRQIILTVSFDL